MNEPLFTVEEAAAWLHMSKKTLYELTAAHAVPCTRPTGNPRGRIKFTLDHLKAIAKAGEQPVIKVPTPIRTTGPRAGLVDTHPPAGPSSPPPPPGPKTREGRAA